MRRRKSPMDESEPYTAPANDPVVVKSVDAPSQASIGPHSSLYFVAKWSMLRLLGLVYWFAFWGAYYQNEGLMGSHGLQPASMDELLSKYASNRWQGFRKHPTLFFWIPLNDDTVRAAIVLGLCLSTLVVMGVNSWLLQLSLWLLDFSIVTIAKGTSFYAYGWESQLLETGFLAIFLCALPHWDNNGRYQLALWESQSTRIEARAPSPSILWLFRWLCFRISLGAGLIKIRGSSCWTDKTCLWYHFETQPIPSPLSFFYHFLPRFVQSRMVDVDVWVQLYTSALVLIPIELLPVSTYRVSRKLLRLGGLLQVGFMVGILLSGNFAFLNHLTMVPALACIDDDWTPKALQNWLARSQNWSKRDKIQSWYYKVSRRWLDVALFLWIGVLSWPVVSNLVQLSSRQLMNASFDSFRIVNTYGAFGSVGKHRYEAIIQVSDSLEGPWTEIELPCKPGTVTRRPCFCAPYHYRMDWNIWFLGFKPHQSYLRGRETWMYPLLRKLLTPGVKPRPWLNLLELCSANDLDQKYYQHGRAPYIVKVDMYHYKMSKSLQALAGDWLKGEQVQWWKRSYEENLVPPLVLTGEQFALATPG